METCAEPSTSSSILNKIKFRKFTKIPVFVTENHNDVLELVLPALANRYLPFQNNLMIHLDSHPDLCVPRQMKPETIYAGRQALLESLSIENWLVPMLYAGHLKEIAWIRPPWSHQIPDGSHSFSVGDADEKIHVSSSLDYFLSDGGYKEEKLLKNANKVTLHVTEIGDTLNELISDEAHWILDIDLDYFSTFNPFMSIYPKARTFEKLRTIYKVDKKYDSDDPESIANYVSERNRLLDFLETVFEHMAQQGSLEKFKCEDSSLKKKFELVEELVQCLCHHYSLYDIDWYIVNNAGCTCDDEEFQLPHHESSDDEIETLLKKLEKSLKTVKKPPTLVTIARSSLDGYTPTHQVDSIQSKVLQVLRNVFAEDLATETLWYKNKASDTSALDMVQPKTK